MASKEALKIYRGMIRMVKKMPAKDQTTLLSQIREGFRNSSILTDPSELQKSLEKANSTLSYLKMVTPKRQTDQAGTFRKVYYNNTVEGSGRKAVTNWHGSNLDPDQRTKHFKQLERAGFKNNSHAKGIF